MLKDMESAGELHKPTRFWKRASQAIVDDLHRYGIESFRQHPGALTWYVPFFGVAHLAKNRNIRKILKILSKTPKLSVVGQALTDYITGESKFFNHYRIYSYFKGDLPALSESSVGRPHEQFNVEGQKMSRAFLNCLKFLAFVKKAQGKLPNRVLEIGGGYGSLGEILLKANPEGRYLNVDIPPLSFISAWYLKQVFGEKNVLSYDTSKDMSGLDVDALFKTYKAIVICPWQLPRVTGHFDFAMNFFSFQEMEPAVVKNYASEIQRLGPKNLLFRNRRTGQVLATSTSMGGVLDPIKTEDYIRYFSDYRLLDSDSYLFGQKNYALSGDVYRASFESVLSFFEKKSA